MRRIGFYKTNHSGNVLHIETEGGIVNIYVGMENDKGEEITSVEFIPDRYAGEPEVRLEAGPSMVRFVRAKREE